MQNPSTLCVLLLLGHVIGDFYLQSDAIAKKKHEALRCLLLHAALYMLGMAVPLGGAALLVPDWGWLWLWLFAGITHLLIDILKRRIKYKPFILDQLFHLVTLGVAALIWGQALEARPLASYAFSFLPSKPLLTVITGLLCLMRPVGLLIASGEIWDFSKAKTPPDESQQGAGRMIGYLERLIVYFLLLYGQVGAVAFVIASKAVIRFPEIKAGQTALAEYFLIGTLLSMAFAFAIPLALGLLTP